MSTPKTYKRKLLNFSVKREMQFRMIGRIFLLLFVSLLLSGLIFYLFADREVTNSFQMFHVKATNFLDFLLPAVFGSFVISLIVGAVGSLFFPKSITGGIYRIEQDLQKVLGQGDLTVQIHLREGDQVDALAAEINNLLLDYRGRAGRFDKVLELFEQYVAAEKAAPGTGDLPATQQACEQMRAELQQLKF